METAKSHNAALISPLLARGPRLMDDIVFCSSGHTHKLVLFREEEETTTYVLART